MALNSTEIERHKRHILLKEIGGPGVQKLRAAHITIIGAGALGGPCALYLAAAGVGTIEIWDDDVVDRSNLQRQIQYEEQMIGTAKVAALADRLRAMNPAVEIRPQKKRFATGDVIPGQILIDATDNFQTRFALNRLAHGTQRYLVSGAASRWSGQIGVFASGCETDAPCYQCFVPEMPPEAEACDDVGVVGPLTGIVASHMALEAMKLCIGAGQSLIGKLTLIEGLSGHARTLKLHKNPDCTVCQP